MKFLRGMFWLVAGCILFNPALLLRKKRLSSYLLRKFNEAWACER